MKKIHIVKVMPTETGFSYYMIYAEDRKLIKFWDEEKYGDDESPLFVKPLIRWLRENEDKIQIVEHRILGVKDAERFDDEIHTEGTDINSLQFPIEEEDAIDAIDFEHKDMAEQFIKKYLKIIVGD